MAHFLYDEREQENMIGGLRASETSARLVGHTREWYSIDSPLKIQTRLRVTKIAIRDTLQKNQSCATTKTQPMRKWHGRTLKPQES